MVDALQVAESIEEPAEGFSPRPYQDPRGIWTIGLGSTRDAAGQPVTAFTPPVTLDEARKLAMRDMTAALSEVQRDVRVPLNPLQAGALADFVYNVGGANLRTSTLLRKLNAGDYAGAAAEFERWDMAGGRALAGLLRRRIAERNAFLTPPAA